MTIKEYLNNKKEVSKVGAYLSLNRRLHAAMYNKIFLFKPFFKLADIVYHHKVMNIIDNVVKSKDFFNCNFNRKKQIKSGSIFYMWWDGIDKLPLVCKLCYESLLEKSNGHDVIFLDKTNYSEYVDLPSFIIKKFESGSFSITLLSDIIRLYLLSTYDCVWVDSTMYFVDSIPERLYDNSFTSCNSKYITKDIHDATAIVNYHYPVYFFISNKGFIFNEVATILTNYWNNYNKPIDYFLTNYIFDYVIKNNLKYRKYIKNMEECNPRVEWLLRNIDKKYDRNEFEKIVTHTFMFKLNWKRKYKNDNNNSYYYYLLNGGLVNYETR